MPRLKLPPKKPVAPEAEAPSADDFLSQPAAPTEADIATRWADLLPGAKTTSPLDTRQSAATCTWFDDETGACTCDERRRTGPLAKLFGRAPTCELVGAAEGTECSDYKRATGNAKDVDLYEQVQLYRAANPEED
jgi:hypothetical protein